MSLTKTAIPFRDLVTVKNGKFTPEIVAQIKAIPDEVILYTDEQVAWMERVLVNLAFLIGEAKKNHSDLSILLERKTEFEEELARQRRLVAGKVENGKG